MSLKKFGQSDIIRNAMRAHPHSNFFIYDSSVYYDHKPIESGSFNSDILSASGGISLHEYNVDRIGTTKLNNDSEVTTAGRNPPIVPYVAGRGLPAFSYFKASPRSRTFVEGPAGSFEITASGPMQVVSDYVANSTNVVFTGSYVMSSSITRELMLRAGNTGSLTNVSTPVNRHYYGLRNSLEYYGARSPHYLVNYSNSLVGTWNKDNQDINLVSIPKIFYGSQIDPGSISLKFYITGTLVGELRDTKHNGELIQVGPEGSTGSGSVAGVAMYEEGFLLLTGSWDLTDGISYDFDTSTTGSWTRFACGANDGQSCSTSASFGVSFDGHTETQILTMYAHARRGEVNYSNNPTFLEFNQTKLAATSSAYYIENDKQTIKNTVSSSYEGFDAPFERQVYVSRVAIYDDDKRLIGVATLSNPVLKKEAQDLSFKLKLDI